MKKPSNRKERINFIEKKKGYDFATTLVYLTDSELKRFFNFLWKKGLKNQIDFAPSFKPATCLRCNKEVEFISVCGCGERRAVIDLEGFESDDEDDQKIKAEYIKNQPEKKINRFR